MTKRRCIDCPALIPAGSRCSLHERLNRQKRETSGWQGQRDRAAVIAAQGRTCQECGRETTQEAGPAKSEVDHTVPVIAGGRGGSNLRVLCRDCNRRKGAR